MIFIVPETNRPSLVEILSRSDDMVEIESLDIINPNAENKHVRRVQYITLFKLTTLPYEDISISSSKRTNKRKN